jgi:type IV pilus assembly protein PilM
LANNGFLDKIKDFINDKLYYGPKGLVGIDIGMSAVKLAEMIKTSDGYKLNRYVSVELPEGTIIEDEIHKEEEILEALQRGIKKLNSSFKFACIGLAGPNTIVKRLQLPGGSADEIEDSVMWEIEQYLPYPIDEANVSFSVIAENAGGGVDVIIGSAKKELVLTFKDLIERCGLKVKIVDLGVTATMNVFEIVAANELSQENTTWILMDLGSQKSVFMIYKNGTMVFTKDINTGGLTITEEIQRQMGVNYIEAESLKVTGDGNGNMPEEIVEIINQVLESFFAEIKKTIDFWMTNSAGEEFAGCFITGGSAQIPGLTEAMQEVIGAEVFILNPFNNFSYNLATIDEKELNNITYKGVIAIGLAMREPPK